MALMAHSLHINNSRVAAAYRKGWPNECVQMEETRHTPPSATFAFSSSFHFQSCPKSTHSFCQCARACAIVPFRAAHAAKYQDSVRNDDETRHRTEFESNQCLYSATFGRRQSMSCEYTCLAPTIRTVAGRNCVRIRRSTTETIVFFSSALAAATFTHSWRRQEFSVGIHLDERPTFEIA